jgi:hypothetical protein
MHVAIATPMYGGNCKGEYMHSVMGLAFALASRGDYVSFPRSYNESIISMARDGLAYEFLDSNADVLLFVDADTSFDVASVVKMIDSDKDIIGAIYPRKTLNWDLIKQAVLSGEEEHLEQLTGAFTGRTIPQGTEIKISEPVEVDAIGTGLMCIKRRVFEEMAPSSRKYIDYTVKYGMQVKRDLTQFFDNAFNEKGELLGEDYYFCSKWKELGGKIYAAPWVNTSHHGDYAFSGSFAETLIFNSKSK